ncbi:hypothetical protein XELAEV_18037189mg [Xenopus laevis]|uniref:Uncharacterized protein n=1 Tax=Xenopus laevis TaxID=8355 RepID=A0A974CBS3_XENLA|nr:hypothetical protein XELAEV_18037189mg [Xenopus laevis]
MEVLLIWSINQCTFPDPLYLVIIVYIVIGLSILPFFGCEEKKTKPKKRKLNHKLSKSIARKKKMEAIN